MLRRDVTARRIVVIVVGVGACRARHRRLVHRRLGQLLGQRQRFAHLAHVENARASRAHRVPRERCDPLFCRPPIASPSTKTNATNNNNNVAKQSATTATLEGKGNGKRRAQLFVVCCYTAGARPFLARSKTKTKCLSVSRD